MVIIGVGPKHISKKGSEYKSKEIINIRHTSISNNNYGETKKVIIITLSIAYYIIIIIKKEFWCARNRVYVTITIHSAVNKNKKRRWVKWCSR